MAGRALAFSDPEIIKLASEQFIPVTGDDWYQRRRQDKEGEFFRQMASQGPRRDPSATKQGIYCFTAGGKLLAYKNAGQNAEVMRAVFKEALAKFKALPPEEQKPPVSSIGERGKLDLRFSPQFPPGGTILKVTTRCLDKDENGQYVDAVCSIGNGDEAARDYVWLKPDEGAPWLPGEIKKDGTYAAPGYFSRRLALFHVLDNTRGEPPFWKQADLKRNEMELVPSRISDEVCEGTIRGHLHLENGDAKRGFQGQWIGRFQWHRKERRLTSLTLVAIGDHWGEGPFTRGARPGRAPLGVLFESVAHPKPAEKIPPQALKAVGDYWTPGL